MAYEFITPQEIFSGSNALELADIFLGQKALIVTDPMMIKLGNTKPIENKLNDNNIQYSIYSDIVGEPTDDMIMNGVVQYERNNCDFLIAIGGGSAIDSMKAIGAIITNGGHINEYLHKIIDKKLPPMVAIPTTAGTGSEATQFTIITNTKENIKMLLKGKALMPNVAIIDPKFSMTAPKSVTASTGLDALCHAIESYSSKKAQPLSKSFSVSALKRIFKYLPIAYQDGQNGKAREQMSIAALEAGIAFNNSSVTIIHGMSRPIGALYHIPHGLSNAILLEECLGFAVDGYYDVFGKLSRELGITNEVDDKLATRYLLTEINRIVQFCEIPSLQELNIKKEDFINNVNKMVKDAIESGSPGNTLRNCTEDDLKKIYLHVIEK